MQMAKRLCLDPAAFASSGACSSSGAASFSAPPSSSGASCCYRQTRYWLQESVGGGLPMVMPSTEL